MHTDRKTITDKDRLSFKSDEFYFKGIDELEVAFSNYPEALANTLKIAEMCNLEIPTGEYHFPEFRPPEGKELNLYLKELCIKGLEKRMEGIEPQKSYLDRLHYELDVIKKTGFAGYFLIVADFINYAKENHIPVGPGRGSAAGSLVAYALGITDIDPIKYDLYSSVFKTLKG
jgi:DNA polymerase-3 subunit alpha